jgi:hypothetical protein
MMDTYSEAWRLECEARTWLQRTQGERMAVNLLLQRIAKRRGQAAADHLREEMRRQYRVVLPIAE